MRIIDVVEACWCLTIALVLHGRCHGRILEGGHWDRGNIQELTEGERSLGALAFNGLGAAELRMMV